jgi:predicted MFS family arabinose efflux permease
MERNLRLYPLFQFFQNLLFWMPVFFLYFSSVLPIDQVLLLEGLYFFSVVILEVPSGYFSDRVGRRVTLILSAAGWASGSIIFFTTSSFVTFLIAQFLYAFGMAMKSGTDTSLLYESLKSLGRGDEIAAREAHAQTYSFSALAISALAGGTMAGFDLRWAYVLSAIAASIALVIAIRFVEPARGDRQAHPPLTQLLVVARRLRDPVLRWLMVFAVAMTVLAHVPYEFYQPYLGFLFGGGAGGYALTPAVAGVLTAIMMAIAALASRGSVALARRLGPGGALLAAVGLLLVIIAAMGSLVHAWIMLLMVLRGVPMALTHPILVSLAHPRLTGSVRATYLSMQSLVGRLAFSATLMLASLAVTDMGTLTEEGLSGILMVYALCTVAVLPVLVLGAVRLSAATRDASRLAPGC